MFRLRACLHLQLLHVMQTLSCNVCKPYMFYVLKCCVYLQMLHVHTKVMYVVHKSLLRRVG